MSINYFDDNWDLIGFAKNISHNCENDISVVKDNCKIICLMTIMKGLDECYFSLFDTGLLDNLKQIIKWCYYKKVEAH